MNKKTLLILIVVAAVVAGCTTAKHEENWKMKLIWHVETFGIPLMDMSPDGKLSAAIDWNRHLLYLVDSNGNAVSFDVQENDPVEPVVTGVVAANGKAYVLMSAAEFAGVRIYTQNGLAGEERRGWSGAVSDEILRSPSGNHLCYMVTVAATKQELYCDGSKVELENKYSLISISDSGLVVLATGDKALVLKNGGKLLNLNSKNVIAYKDRLLVSEDGKLRIYDESGKLLAEKEGYTFGQTTLLRWTLVPTKDYIFWHEALGDTHVLTWDLDEVRTLPGFPYFANDNFVVTVKDGVLHCYSLRDFHKVFNLTITEIGYVRLSNDGKLLLISGDDGNFWLYKAEI